MQPEKHTRRGFLGGLLASLIAVVWPTKNAVSAGPPQRQLPRKTPRADYDQGDTFTYEGSDGLAGGVGATTISYDSSTGVITIANG